ncbi:MAG: LLM class flavin-dependent oxidoreductase [Deltaproteobacteria bacterium]|nr:LLM class flavin-dependent oxidoreductase [Deltaproteobacteria bacterium]
MLVFHGEIMNQRSPSPSCFLVGADSLLLECGEILLQKGWVIAGVAAGSTRVADWARRKGLRTVDVKGPWTVELGKESFDFLFAITHLALIPEEALKTPKRAAINFHDGPLPRFAGLNTPAWALIRGETHYGVSWHRITAGIDEGDLLKQRTFEIAPGETSLSINTRNFDVAMESFSELIDELAEGRESYTPQDKATERFVFSRHDRPPALATLDFSRPAVELDRLVRALDFGRYDNPLASAKLVVGQDAVLVTAVDVRDDAEGSAGDVLSVNAEEIVVRCGEGALALRGFTSLTGGPLTVAQVAERFALASGVNVAALSPERAQRLTEVGKALAKSERFFEARLLALDPVELPWARTAGPAHGAAFKSTPVALPTAFQGRYAGEARTSALVAAFAAALARLSQKELFHLSLRDGAAARGLAEVAEFCAARSPLEVKVTFEAPFETLRANLETELQRTREKGGFLQDLIARRPELSQNPLLVGGQLVPVGVRLDDDQTSPGVVLELVVKDGTAEIAYDSALVDDSDARALKAQLEAVLESVGHTPHTTVATLDLLGHELRKKVVETWNRTQRDYPRDQCLHHLVEAQGDRAPDRTAVIFEDRSISYRELERRANQLAAHLRTLGVGPDVLVGVFVERSIDLVVAVQAVHKAGGAYVPLDPSYPRDRIEHMVVDSRCQVVITQERLVGELPAAVPNVVRIDAQWDLISRQSDQRVRAETRPEHLAYCIYTSGSTGKPKGVLVEHRNVVNFFEGMDDRVEHKSAERGEAVWMAVTSLSFDISVLELFYTLTRGFTVLVYLDRDKSASDLTHGHKPLDFSLFYFSGDESEHTGPGKYRLLLEGAKYADEHGFVAVWTPERHFYAFGGLYPNPAVTGAAVATVTKRVKVRAGSVVLPLHHPIRVAEAWSIVDNLSNGRVEIAFASGWAPTDFVLMPQNYKNAKTVMFENIDLVQRLWRGEKVKFPGATGDTVEVSTLPRPVSKELPIWITTAGNPETYEQAGRAGANVLTHLLGQSIEQLVPKIEAYRRARKEAGFDPDTGVITLMLHTYVGDDADKVRETVRGPLKQYLGTSLNLLKQYAWAFPAFQKPKNADLGGGDDFASLTPEEQDAVLEFAFLRYYETSGLFGTPDQCVAFADKLKAVGVDEIACLIDFGVATDTVLQSLPHLDEVRRKSNAFVGRTASAEDFSPAAQLRRHKVTHMQCTPSMARMLSMHDDAREALANVKHVFIGGEAFPVALAKELSQLVKTGDVTNMYGPTETTIWSSTWRLHGALDVIPIGTPIANTQLYILDKHLQPLPPGVPGELYIGGDGVVRGYLDRPELTAERFVNDPFRSAGARMYRTGDLAKWRELPAGAPENAGGLVEFLGRVDHQVKIRGYRIELGEIESQLSQHPAVRECVVVVREETPGDQQLVGFCSTKEGMSLDPEDVKTHLRKNLPEFMVPGHIATLEELPHTPNGKIDRKKLPSLKDVLGARSGSTELVAAESDVEKKVLTVWKETLGKDEISVDDNFFDIGGHSLLVVRMHRRLKDTIERPVSLTDLYRFPTIRTFAEYVSSDGTSASAKRGADRAARRKEMRRR